ncbi:GGDEF domain-containing protein [Bacillus sp. DNRA2]|uniref:GGDEF domain-containing protein n=1 Tax=Bacillus sp. DNRA2 TaxID=2723053 RepID=UPI00145E1BAD|nr:GGDEF domain-containing protein [Bacillus sp. DNRA2]NMD72408.1 GGDEF domain-containing protein [Bacillus sp. DNRA2]
MSLVYNLGINIYSILFLIIIYFHSLSHDDKESLQYKLYMRMLQITIIMLVADIFSRFDGNSYYIYSILNQSGNFFVFLLNAILPSLWLLYVHFQVFQDEAKTRRLFYPLLAINGANAVIVILSQFFGWFYYIDSDNIYHRGPLFLVSASLTIVMLLIAFVIIIVNHKKIEKKHFFSLVFFAFPPFVSIFLQIAFYGISLMLNSVVLSLLVVFLNIQNRSLHIDYLTETNNRKNLEIYLKEKIRKSSEDKTFSAMMIDLNDFKSINDTFGHDIGDSALQMSVKLLKSCLRSNDFIARYGGDEFCVVLDISNRDELEEIAGRINCCVEKYNESSAQPYKLGFSMGYAVYDYHSHMKAEEFQKQIDTLMYENKQAYKQKMRMDTD